MGIGVTIMEQICYMNKLNELEIIMDNNKSSPFNNFVKVLCLTTMNMRYEKIAFDLNLNDHPYFLTKKIIEDTIIMYQNIMGKSYYLKLTYLKLLQSAYYFLLL